MMNRQEQVSEAKLCIDQVTAAFFRVFTNKNGANPNVHEVSQLFVPTGMIVKNTGSSPEFYNLQQFIEPRVRLLTDGSLVDFEEEEIFERTEIFGNIAHRFSLYRKSGVSAGEPFEAKGMKSIQFINTSDGWKILSLAWDDEREGVTIPEQYRVGHMLSFRSIDPIDEREKIVKFFIDAGNGEDTGPFDEDDYVKAAKQKADDLPEGFVFAEQEGNTVGELALRIMPYEGRSIGFVSLLYVLPDFRGKGFAQQMFAYMEEVFKRHDLSECHLRVSQTNHRAIRFYEKEGFSILQEERNKRGLLCWRMGKVFPSV